LRPWHFPPIPIVANIIKKILQSLNWEVKEEGKGLDLAFHIKSGEKDIKFFLHNLLLEIATIDRDQEPLRFDERLLDFDFFMDKTAHLTESKLNILFHLFGKEDLDTAIDNITKDAKQYERIRIWRFDQNKTGRTQDQIQSE
jgi:hypothetical protein